MHIEKKQNLKVLKALEAKKKIYESAKALFEKNGFENVSVDSIVEMAGIAKGSFYVHYDSKQALIAELISYYVSKLDTDYKSHIEAFSVDCRVSEVIISLAGKIADIISNSIGYDIIRVIYEVYLTRSVDSGALLEYNRELYKLFNTLIEQGIKQGEFNADIPAEMLSRHYVLALRGLTYEWCIRYPQMDLIDCTLKHFEILINGIKIHKS